MASPGVSSWGLHHPPLVNITFLHSEKYPFVKLSSAKFCECTTSFLPGSWPRQKLNFLIRSAQVKVVRLGLRIRQSHSGTHIVNCYLQWAKPQIRPPMMEKREASRSNDTFSYKIAMSSGYRVSNKEACGLNVSLSLLEISSS